jgi:molybdate transport system substrate-binding protein
MKFHRRSILIVVVLLSLTIVPSQASLTRSGRTTLTVFAASSLAATFTTLGKTFERQNPSVRVEFSFLASSTLATQINANAPADVFASASVSDMNLAGNLLTGVTLFASNRVILATPRVNRIHINKIVDLNQHGVKWIQCAHVVPCGAAADAALAGDGRISSKPVSYEPKVSSAVAKVVNGEVDAAIIYHTDYLANRGVLKEIRFADTAATTTEYPIGIVKSSKQAGLAKSFVSLVLSSYGRKILAEAGFSQAK